jgi:hypothetical protein
VVKPPGTRRQHSCSPERATNQGFGPAPIYSAFDLNVQVESAAGITGITGKSKTKHPRGPPWSPWFVTPEYSGEKSFRARVPIVSGAGGFSTG